MDPDRIWQWGDRRSEKSRLLLNGLLDWQPDKHFYFKVDTDVVLFPERLLHFLRTLEAAVGTAQPLFFGKAIPPFMQVGWEETLFPLCVWWIAAFSLVAAVCWVC